jgi:hypothetical protein
VGFHRSSMVKRLRVWSRFVRFVRFVRFGRSGRSGRTRKTGLVWQRLMGSPGIAERQRTSVWLCVRRSFRTLICWVGGKSQNAVAGWPADWE